MTVRLAWVLLAGVALGGCSVSSLGDFAMKPVNTIKNGDGAGAGATEKNGFTTDGLIAAELEKEIAEFEPILLGGADDLVQGPPPIGYEEFSRKALRGKYVPPQLEKARYDSLSNAATAYAAQAGYYRRCFEIMQALEKQSPTLSQVFNFNRVAYGTANEAGHLLPPIVSRATATIEVNETMTEIVAADEYYRIEVPGRLVPVLPTWRDYLILALEEPNDPEPAFMPRGDEEKDVWGHYLVVGWRAGVEQADAALQASMHLLRRDYLGMVEYRRAVQVGVIKELVVDLNSSRSAGELNELYVGERRVRIVDSAEFKRDPRQWKPLRRPL